MAKLTDTITVFRPIDADIPAVSVGLYYGDSGPEYVALCNMNGSGNATIEMTLRKYKLVEIEN